MIESKAGTSPTEPSYTLADIAEALAQAMTFPEAAMAVVADCVDRLQCVAGRTRHEDEWEAVEIFQKWGPTVEFQGRLLAQTTFKNLKHKPLEMVFEIWETQAGAYVAVSSSTLIGGNGTEECKVKVVEKSQDQRSMQFAVMDAFMWHQAARNLGRQLGWSLTVNVE